MIGRKVRGKTQAWAIVYPNRDAVLARLDGAHRRPEDRAHAGRGGDRRQQTGLAAYKRIVDFMLTDAPLPKTALRKVARGQIAESYNFEPGRWAESWRRAGRQAANRGRQPSRRTSEERVS